MLFNFLVFGVLLVLAASALLEWLWNMTIPELFGLKVVTYWQALRLLLIAGLLFGAFHINSTGVNFGL